MTFTAFYNGSQDPDVSAIIFREDQRDDLVFGISDHQLAGIHRIGISNPCKQQTKKIVNLGDGTHSRPGIPVGGFLLNGNDRTQAVDFIHIRAFEVPDKLACIC